MRPLFVTAAALLALALPSAAQAATATTADGNLRYTAAPGEVNNVSFARVSGDTFRVTDVGAVITAGARWVQGGPNAVRRGAARGRAINAPPRGPNDQRAAR